MQYSMAGTRLPHSLKSVDTITTSQIAYKSGKVTQTQTAIILQSFSDSRADDDKPVVKYRLLLLHCYNSAQLSPFALNPFYYTQNF